MQRRAERGRPAANANARSMRLFSSNIKDHWEDEAPEWQEADEVSDYNTFVYLPPFHPLPPHSKKTY